MLIKLESKLGPLQKFEEEPMTYTLLERIKTLFYALLLSALVISFWSLVIIEISKAFAPK